MESVLCKCPFPKPNMPYPPGHRLFRDTPDSTPPAKTRRIAFPCSSAECRLHAGMVLCPWMRCEMQTRLCRAFRLTGSAVSPGTGPTLYSVQETLTRRCKAKSSIYPTETCRAAGCCRFLQVGTFSETTHVTLRSTEYTEGYTGHICPYLLFGIHTHVN